MLLDIHLQIYVCMYIMEYIYKQQYNDFDISDIEKLLSMRTTSQKKTQKTVALMKWA